LTVTGIVIVGKYPGHARLFERVFLIEHDHGVMHDRRTTCSLTAAPDKIPAKFHRNDKPPPEANSFLLFVVFFVVVSPARDTWPRALFGNAYHLCARHAKRRQLRSRPLRREFTTVFAMKTPDGVASADERNHPTLELQRPNRERTKAPRQGPANDAPPSRRGRDRDNKGWRSVANIITTGRIV
jgi:hypothetical protein